MASATYSSKRGAMDNVRDPAFLIVGFCFGIVLMSAWMVVSMVWLGLVERIGMWYVVITGGKPKPIYATKPPRSEGDVISEHENYCDAVRSADEVRRQQPVEQDEAR